MIEAPRTPFPKGFIRTILLLILSLVSAIYFLQKNLSQIPGDGVSMMAMTPVPALPKKAASPPEVVREVTVQKNQTFSELMKDQGLDGAAVHEILDGAKEVYNLSRIGVGKTMKITLTPDLAFAGLEYKIDPLQTLVVHKRENQIHAEMRKYTPDTSLHELGGYIYGSLYSSIDKLGEEDELVMRFAEIFEWDIDFFKDLQAGDSFRIVYEKQTVNGEPLRYGNIVAAELVNKKHVYTAIGHQRGKDWEFFSPDGKAMKKAFLASPLKFTRISSGFTGKRYHPVLKKYRPHYGIDYAAPTGTPVRAIGKGRVVSAGWAGGAGKMIKIQHDNEISTAYYHLSRFAPGVSRGASVSQGQVIGYVGSTGLATGPHLDFRFMKNGRYVNFLNIRSPQAQPLSSAEIAAFKQATASMAARLQTVALQQPAADMAFVPANSTQFTE